MPIPDRLPNRRCWAWTLPIRGRIVVLTLALLGIAATTRADEVAPDAALAAELKQDVVLRAMVDELQRSADQLALADLARPYFIEYALMDVHSGYASAELGALTLSNVSPSRALRVDVRVGSYEQDNSNFAGAGWNYNRAAVPIDDEYTAIRQALWWATDRDYKQAAEDFARKQAFMQQKVIEDKPADFSQETPVIHFEERLTPQMPRAEMEKLVIDLSAVFRDYPEVQESVVRMRCGAGNAYLVNTEGTRLRENGETYELAIEATVQANDGMPLADTIMVVAERFDALPSSAQLQQQCRDLAERMTRLKHAPKLTEAYAGPVLFDPRPAATIFGANFAQQFAGGQRPVGSRSNPDDFEKKLGKRILPRSVTVVDDPTRKSMNNTALLGHYRYDDQGVPARPVTLVEGGRLQALVMSRNPSKAFKQSTGHGRGMYRPTAMTGNLIVSAEDAADADALKQELIEAVDDEGLEYGIRIASLRGGMPVEIYKVFPDGREELFRGADSLQINLRAFKRILALGDAPCVLNVSGRVGGQTIIAPAMLFEELDVTPLDRDFDKPPFLPAPLARQDQAKPSETAE